MPVSEPVKGACVAQHQRCLASIQEPKETRSVKGCVLV